MTLLPLAKVCQFLGKYRADYDQLLEAGLPVVSVPTKTGSVWRVVPSAFVRWMALRMAGKVTQEDLRRDLEEFLKSSRKRGGAKK